MKKLLGIVVLGLLWCNVGVAGTLGVKALAKAGILAKFLPLLAKFWWIIIAPIVAFFGFLGKNDSSEVSRRRKRRK
jgi:uncharacterized membrane-anchored protein